MILSHTMAISRLWCCCEVLLVFFVWTEPSYAFSPGTSLPPRSVHHTFSALRIKTSRVPSKRSCFNMSLWLERDSTAFDNDRASWCPVKVLLSTAVATSLMFSGGVPSLELQSHSTMQKPSVEQGMLTIAPGVPMAHAAKFNDEQRTIAETWVGVSW